ncbi:MAG TPA: hypothetical protein VKF37_00170 [Chloroflexota bacterium]|nr:hypothetical protein [Chloroflexota bacterium]
MPFPWSRYWRRVGALFVVVLLVSLAAALALNEGRLGLEAVLVTVVDSVMLAVVAAFPLTQRIYRGPRR